MSAEDKLDWDITQLTSSIPRAQEVDTPWEEAGLQDTKNKPKSHQFSPVLYEAHSNHHGAPCDGNSREKVSRSKFANDNGGRGLEKDVGNEEDQHNGRLKFTVSNCCIVGKCYSLTYRVPTVNLNSLAIL